MYRDEFIVEWSPEGTCWIGFKVSCKEYGRVPETRQQKEESNNFSRRLLKIRRHGFYLNRIKGSLQVNSQ